MGITVGDDFELRMADDSDAEALIVLHDRVQGEGQWTSILTDGTHPTTKVENFTVIEDVKNKKIVSSMCYIPQVWRYGTESFNVARLEMVSTLEEYRSKGFIRMQFQHIHEICASNDCNVTVVVGIPWFYKKFGYDMALKYWNQNIIPISALHNYTDNKKKGISIAAASISDITFYTKIALAYFSKFDISCEVPENYWKHLFFERKGERLITAIIKSDKNESIGAICHAPALDENALTVFFCDIIKGISWLDVAPALFDYFKRIGNEFALKDNCHFDAINFGLNMDVHPINTLLTDCPAFYRRAEAPFAWYVRVNDMAKFTLNVKKTLENRLADSLAQGYSGSLKIGFYSGGLTLTFENGTIIDTKNGMPENPDCSIPQECFKQLLFGYKSLEELRLYSAEVNVGGVPRILLGILFPKTQSSIFSIC